MYTFYSLKTCDPFSFGANIAPAVHDILPDSAFGHIANGVTMKYAFYVDRGLRCSQYVIIIILPPFLVMIRSMI